ncbi:MAG: MBL fold metallo-hydrolase [Bacteroidota bacterium]
MKKILKRILLILAIFILILIIVGVVFYFRFRAETKNMNPVPTGQVTADVVAIKDGIVNMFLIKDSNQYVAVDAGNNAEAIGSALKALGIDPTLVEAVLLTHTDRDHVAALPLFTNAKIYISRPEELMITGKKKKFLWFGNSLGNAKYTLLDDGQTLQIGKLTIKGILTAGHTSGSMCYQVNKKYLFTGDILTLKDGHIQSSIKLFDMDHEAAIKAIPLITKLPGVQYIFTAHTGFTNDYARAVK